MNKGLPLIYEVRSKIKEEGANWRSLGKFFSFFKGKKKQS
jgi:hypothetical protein